MEEEMANVMGAGSSDMKTANLDEEQISFQMEVDEGVDKRSRNENEAKISDQGEGSNVVFAREGPLYAEEPGVGRLGCYGGDRLKSKIGTTVSKLGKREETGSEKKLSKQDRTELARLFQGAVSSHDWETADSLILLADPNTLNDFLCIALDSIWFLCTQQDLLGITRLIKRTVNSGAYDFTRAALRTSFLASCVSACRSRTMSLPDAVTVMVQRLQERLQECNGDYVLKAEAGIKVQKFTEWALKCIGFHSRCHGDKERDDQAAAMEIQLQLSAFKTFLDLAGNNLNGRDFTEAFDAACFPLTLFSSSFDPGWSAGTSASVVQGLLGLLVEGGADNVNQCFLEASRFGSTELVRILLQIAHRNSLDVDVDLALGFASHYGKINTMECLVEEGHAMAFLGPLMRAAERGCLPVVQWFVQRGCQDMELCLALTAATSSSHVEVAAYLLPHVPRHVLAALSIEILKVAGERSGRSLEGVAFLLRSDFLGDPAATYAVAESIAGSALGVGEENVEENGGRIGALSSPSGGGVLPNLKSYLKENWSEWAYMEGLRKGTEHFVNMARIVHRGESPLRVGDLPVALRVAISYLPLYVQCTSMLNGEAGGGGDGCLLSQRLRGELVEAVRRLGGVVLDGPGQSRELLAVMEHHLRPFLPGLTTEWLNC